MWMSKKKYEDLNRKVNYLESDVRKILNELFDPRDWGSMCDARQSKMKRGFDVTKNEIDCLRNLVVEFANDAKWEKSPTNKKK